MTDSERFLARLGLCHPVVQAPMAGVSTPQLAAAVSNAGGLGSLGIGAGTAAQARESISATRALTARPFNVNVFCHAPPARNAEREAAWLRHLGPLFDEVGATSPDTLDEVYRTFVEDDATLAVLLDLRPAVVSFHFGLPRADAISALRQTGATLLATATCVEEALSIERAGIDAIVAQGVEAGGHRGVFDPRANDERLSTAVLVRLLTRRTRLPVIAAGGIMDGAGIRSALDLGAVAAQLGTAFVLCPESAANAGYREMLRSDRAAATRLTSVVSGRPARGIVNRLIAFGEAPGSPVPADYPLAYDAAKRIHGSASRAGDHEFAAHWAGQGAPLAREMPAEALVRQLVAEWRGSADEPVDAHRADHGHPPG